MRLLITMTAFFCVVILQAQVKFEKGYFVNNAGTKTQCYIKNWDWVNNPIEFSYKLSEDGESQTGKILDISEFAVDGAATYHRFDVEMEQSITDANKLTKNKLPHFKNETVFLKMLIAGKANLYMFTNGLVKKFFFSKNNQTPVQLVYIRYINENGDAAQNNQFRQQLLNALSDGNITEKDVAKIRYKESELLKVFEKYNNPTAEKSTRSAQQDDGKTFAIRVAAGASLSSVNLEIPPVRFNQIFDDEVSTDAQLNAKFGFELEYSLPVNRKSWRIFANPMYSKFEADQTFVSRSIFSVPTNNTVSIKFNLIEVPIGLRYYGYISDASKIFFDAAYVVNLYNGTEIVYNASEAKPYKLDSFKSRNSLAFGMGYGYRKFAVATILHLPRKFSNNSYQGTYKSTSIQLRYELF